MSKNNTESNREEIKQVFFYLIIIIVGSLIGLSVAYMYFNSPYPYPYRYPIGYLTSDFLSYLHL